MSISVKILDCDGKELRKINDFSVIKELLDSGEAIIVRENPFTIMLTEELFSLLRYPIDLTCMSKSDLLKIEVACRTMLAKLKRLKSVQGEPQSKHNVI